MNKVVAVPGVGNVAFPDSMSDDDISLAIQQQTKTASAPAPPGRPAAAPGLAGPPQSTTQKIINTAGAGMGVGAHNPSDSYTQQAVDILGGTVANLGQGLLNTGREIIHPTRPGGVGQMIGEGLLGLGKSAVSNAGSGNYAEAVGDAGALAGNALALKNATGAEVPTPTKTVGKLARGATERTPFSATINDLSGVSPRDLTAGINPGEQLIKDGVPFTGSKTQLREVYKARRTETGQELANHLNQHNNATIDLSQHPTMQMPEAQEVLAGMQKNPKAPFTPLEAHLFRSQLGDYINWSKDAQATPENDALTTLYHDVNRTIEKAAPGTKDLNAKWRNYDTGYRRAKYEVAKQGVTAPGTAVSTYGELRKLAQSTPVVTGLMKLLGY